MRANEPEQMFSTVEILNFLIWIDEYVVYGVDPELAGYAFLDGKVIAVFDRKTPDNDTVGELKIL